MKKIFMVLSSLLFLFIVGCATSERNIQSTFESKESALYKDIVITAKDFIIKGPIYVESVVTITDGEKNGSEITSYMLMKEAQKLGADDFVNVKIDKVEELKKTETKNQNRYGFKTTKTKTITYKATALAIKYK